MPDEPRQKSGDLAPRTLIAASAAGALATAAISGAGLAGSLIGGAVFPVIITLARELVLRAVDRAPRPRVATPGGMIRRPERRSAIRWRRVAVTAGAAVAIVVATYTAAEVFLGESVVSDRRTTFFSGSPAGPSPPSEPAPAADEEPDRETTTTTAPEDASPATPAPGETTPPQETTPSTVPEAAPEPAETAPAETDPAAPQDPSVAPSSPVTTTTESTTAAP